MIIFEPNFTGHRMSFCSALMTSPINDTDAILATTSEALSSPEFAYHLSGVDPERVLNVGPLFPITERGYSRWSLRIVRKLLKESVGVVVLEGDKSAPSLAFGLPRARGLRILIMRAPAKPAQISNWSSWITFIVKKFSMYVLRRRGADVVVLAPAQTTATSYQHNGYPAVPDPVEIQATPGDVERFKLAHRMDSGRKWVGLVGRLTPRKNLALVLQAVEESASGSEDRWGLLLAGDLDPAEMELNSDTIERLRATGCSVVIKDELLTNQELDAAVGAVDLLVLAHSSEGPSGILGKASRLGTAVVAAGALSLRRDVERLSCGVWVPLEAGSIAGALITSGKVSPVALAGNAEFRRWLGAPLAAS